MSHDPRLGALALAGAALTTCLLGAAAFWAPHAQAATPDYGSLSRKYETGGDPSAADSYWGYGAYQMLSDTAFEYANWLSKKSNDTYQSWGKGLSAAHKKDSSGSNLYFNAMWRYIAGEKLSKLSNADEKRVKKILKTTKVHAGSRKKALSLQYSYTVKVYYKPAVKYWKKVAPKLDPDDYTLALRSVIFSIAVANGPYGSAYSIFKPALKAIGGWKSGMDEGTLIKALYDERSRAVKKAPGSPAYKITSKTKSAKKYKLVGKYLKHYYSSSPSVQVAVYKRFHVDEKNDALKLLKTCQTCKHTKTTGGKVTKYYRITDATHYEKRTAKVCKICGKTLEEAGSFKVDNVYVMQGAEYKDVSGHSYTVHGKGTYEVSSSSISLRKSASKSASSRVKVGRGTTLKVTKSKLADDGFWWGKVTYAKKTGWTRMKYLSPFGTASAHVFDKQGTCEYCKITRAQESAMEKIRTAVKKGSRTCTFVQEGASYKAAYASSGMLAKRHARGSKVKVTKVVKNVYNDYWAELSNGTYVDLSLLK